MRSNVFPPGFLVGLLLFCPTLAADEISELKQRVEQLEAQLAEQDTALNKKVDKLSNDIRLQHERLRVSGFATVGVTKSDVDFETADREFTEELNFSTDTKAGLQADFDIAEQWHATIQFTANAYENWNTEVEWAFIKYQPRRNLWFRVGRLRFPLYYFSESLDVGFAYPWVRPPMAFYVTSIANFEGMDATYSFYTGEFTHEISLHMGATEGKLPAGLETKVEDIRGLVYQITFYDFGLRFMTQKSTVTNDFSVIQPLSFLGELSDKSQFSSVAFSYIGENLYLLVEGILIDSEWTFIREGEQGQATIGYQWGPWMPFASYTYTSTSNEDKAKYPDIFDPQVQLDNSAVGLRYDINSNVNLKLQYDHFYNLGGTSSSNFQGLEEGTDVYTINVNAIF